MCHRAFTLKSMLLLVFVCLNLLLKFFSPYNPLFSPENQNHAATHNVDE